MKTYEEIVDDLIEYHFKNVSPGHVDIKKQAAKEYAKQWVVRAADKALYCTDGEEVDVVLTCIKEIDAQ